jgi:hypothetical protein
MSKGGGKRVRKETDARKRGRGKETDEEGKSLRKFT